MGKESKSEGWAGLKATALACDRARREVEGKPVMAYRPRCGKRQTRMELEEAMAAFRMGRRAAGAVESWVRAVRLETGVSAEELARRMGLKAREVFRQEKSEREGRIGLGTLRAAAEALGCEVVYALMPRQGTLGELAAREQAERDEARRRKKAVVDRALRKMGARGLMRKAVRRVLREEGLRVR